MTGRIAWEVDEDYDSVIERIRNTLLGLVDFKRVNTDDLIGIRFELSSNELGDIGSITASICQRGSALIKIEDASADFSMLLFEELRETSLSKEEIVWVASSRLKHFEALRQKREILLRAIEQVLLFEFWTKNE